MNRYHRQAIFVIALLCYTAFLIYGLKLVPFHPDESSLLYQSRDLEILFTQPRTLAYDPIKEGDPSQEYRALNAPFGKYVIGIGRVLAGYGPETVSVDWNWAQSWEENVAAEALPDNRLLWGSRLAVTLLLPLSLIAIYVSGKHIGGEPTGVMAAIFLGMNALTLLHDRRAMSEGAMTFGICVAILGLLVAHRQPWLAGLGSAIAFTSKYSTLPILLVGLLACLWIPHNMGGKSLNRWTNLFKFILVMLVVVLLLHPFLWSDPIKASAKIWQARQDLLDEQVETLEALLPAQLLDTAPERFFMLIGHLYITPLQFAEVGNYQEQTANAEMEYMENPLHLIFRGSVGGGLLLMMTLLGVSIGGYRAIQSDRSSERRSLSLLILLTLLQAIFLLLVNPLPIQRYYLPLIPFVCLWAAFGITRPLTQIAAQGTGS